MMEQKKRPPQPRFLNSCFGLLSNYKCDFSKSQLSASETEVKKDTKSAQIKF